MWAVDIEIAYVFVKWDPESNNYLLSTCSVPGRVRCLGGIPRRVTHNVLCLRNPDSSLRLVTDPVPTVDPYYSWILYL